MAFAFQQDVPINMDIYRAIIEQLGEAPPDGLIVHLVIEQRARTSLHRRVGVAGGSTSDSWTSDCIRSSATSFATRASRRCHRSRRRRAGGHRCLGRAGRFVMPAASEQPGEMRAAPAAASRIGVAHVTAMNAMAVTAMTAPSAWSRRQSLVRQKASAEHGEGRVERRQHRGDRQQSAVGRVQKEHDAATVDNAAEHDQTPRRAADRDRRAADDGGKRTRRSSSRGVRSGKR